MAPKFLVNIRHFIQYSSAVRGNKNIANVIFNCELLLKGIANEVFNCKLLLIMWTRLGRKKGFLQISFTRCHFRRFFYQDFHFFCLTNFRFWMICFLCRYSNFFSFTPKHNVQSNDHSSCAYQANTWNRSSNESEYHSYPNILV